MTTFLRNVVLIVFISCVMTGLVNVLAGAPTFTRYADLLMYAGFLVVAVGASTLIGNPGRSQGDRHVYNMTTSSSNLDEFSRQAQRDKWASYSFAVTGIVAGALTILLSDLLHKIV